MGPRRQPRQNRDCPRSVLQAAREHWQGGWPAAAAGQRGLRSLVWTGAQGADSSQAFHYDWHWFWDYGNGDVGNQGIHQMDIARWFLGEPELSPRGRGIGGRLGYEDDGETPNTLIAYHDYEKAPLIFEVRGLPRDKSRQTDKVWNSGEMDRYPDEKGKGGSVCVIIECEG